MIYNSVLELVGNTPLLRLNNIEKEFNLEATLLAKLESFNPTGSAKDRPAKAIIEKCNLIIFSIDKFPLLCYHKMNYYVCEKRCFPCRDLKSE